ncbi:hypothetical protein LCGC14_2295620 [marine sediment metagenome]|uniref:Uncharacterized protein n=1 Tax=marine sediment metagenome TaxID=412755 RepID=A0A0F9CQH2_9ZZZZ
MSVKSALGSIIVGVICSVLIMSGMLYFIGPILLPGLTEKDTSLLLQYKYQEWDSHSYITEEDLVDQKMNETELSITIQENSRLATTFSSVAELWLSYFFTGYVAYSISLVVEGVGNRTISVTHFDMRTTGGWQQEMTHNLNIDYLTGPLSAGTYNITMYWKSIYNSTDYTHLSVAHSNYFNTRSLWVQELKSL